MLGLGSSLALGGAPSEFVLTNISGLDIWLQYDTGFTADGSDAISQWDDQSGNDNHAVQATTDFKPTLVSGAASFADANRDKMTFTAITNTVSTIFIVIEADSSSSMTMFGNSGDSQVFYRINQAATVEFRIRKGSTAAEDSSDVNSTAEPFIDDSTPHLLVFHQKSGLNMDIHIGGNGADSTHNETNYGVQGGGTNTDLVIDTIGVQGTNGNPFDGRILEFAVYDSTLSDADIALIKANIVSRTGEDLG